MASMIKKLLLIMNRFKLALLLFLLILNCRLGIAQTMIHSEILGRPTDHGVSVQVIFSDSAEVSVKYGLIKGSLSNQTSWVSFGPDEPAEFTISGLLQDTIYYYQLLYRRPGFINFNSRPEYHFHTARPSGKEFTFVIQADPHLDEQSDTAVYNRCLRNQLEDNPDFMIDLGDFLMSDKLKNTLRVIPRDTVTFRSKLLRSYYEKINHSVPLFIALGNHEGESGWNLTSNSNNLAVWSTTDRKKYFMNPSPDNFYSGDTTNHRYVGLRENYYSWQWGDALFIVLDPYWYTATKPDSLNGWRWTLGKVQYDWLKLTLENSSAKYKFVFAHQIIGGDPDGRGGIEFANRYEWGGENLNGTPGFSVNRPGWYKPIKDLLEENRVTIFFHGHDHFFGKQEKDCLIYQETPQPSHPNFSSITYAHDYGYFAGQILPNSGHIRVTVGPDGVKTEYVRVYKQANETPTRHNKDISATYFIGNVNCYDSLNTGAPIIWNSNYEDELVYPNPFSKETKIEFSIKNEDKVNLTLYNENGQLIKKLINNDTLSEGKYEIIWEGKNYEGVDQPNGVYWYVITGEKIGKKTGKIILTR